MKWFSAVFGNSEDDKKVITEFITILIKFDIPRGLALHTLHPDSIKNNEISYFFSVPEKYLNNIMLLLSGHTIVEIAEPDIDNLYTVVGSM